MIRDELKARSPYLGAILVAIIAALVLGCGGSGSTAAPTGREAVRTSSLASYQSLSAGIAFPFTALNMTAPNGGGFVKGIHPTQTRGLTYDQALNLYTDGGITNPQGATVHYFTDSAGAHSAGQMSLTSSQGSFNYSGYPVTITLAVNVTAGNLPCNGQGAIVFNGPSGANTMTGTLKLLRNNETVSINLTLSSTLDVAGTMKISENGTTIQATNVSGPLTGDVTFDFTLLPQAYSGTGTMNLSNATLDLTFTNPSGASCTEDNSGDMVITYPGGSTETIQNPLTAVLGGSTASTSTGSTNTGGSTTGTGGTSGNGFTIAPVPGNPGAIAFVSSDGRMVGSTLYNGGVQEYWASPTSQPQPITLDSTVAGIVATCVNTSGHIVGYGQDPTTLAPIFLYWSAYNQPPVHLVSPSTSLYQAYSNNVLINASNEIVVTSNIETYSVLPASFVYSGPTDTNPYMVQGGSVTAISDSGSAIGVGQSSELVWTPLSSTANPSPAPGPQSSSIKTYFMNPSGNIVVSDLGTNLVWASAPPYANTVSVPAPVGHPSIGASGVGPSGQILGSCWTDQTSLDNDGLLWNTPSSTPINLRSTATPNVLYALYETSAGQLIVVTTPTPEVSVYQFDVMTPKP